MTAPTDGCIWKATSPHEPLNRLYADAVRAEDNGSENCVDLFYQLAVATSPHDGPKCTNCRLRKLHKSALAKLVSTGQRFRRLDPRLGLTVHSELGTTTIPISRHGFIWQAQDFHCLTLVGDYKTDALRNLHRCPGVGIPLVVTNCRSDNNGMFLPAESAFDATLRINAQTSVVRLELYDPHRVSFAASVGDSPRIKKDLSAALAYRLRDHQQTILDNFINTDSESGASGLRMIEPYQPGKIPIVLIHGLLSSPYTWAQMVNELRVAPGFVDRYQIWVFDYPTGQSFLASANELREQLQIARETFDPHRQDVQLANMVLVGHSMGGLVSKLQITSSRDLLWRSVANRPIEQVVMPDRVRRKTTESFFFEPSPDVARVIFISTPHRGSGYATRLIGRIGSSLVEPPAETVADHKELMRCNPGVFTDEVSRRIPTSIDLLEPQSRLLQTISALPVRAGVQMHSVIGDSCGTRLFGKSDGVVPVSSAREGRAVSEIFVTETHSKTKDHPETIDQVLAILNQHWNQPAHSSILHADLEWHDDPFRTVSGK